jgi:hypothetical protein
MMPSNPARMELPTALFHPFLPSLEKTLNLECIDLDSFTARLKRAAVSKKTSGFGTMARKTRFPYAGVSRSGAGLLGRGNVEA